MRNQHQNTWKKFLTSNTSFLSNEESEQLWEKITLKTQARKRNFKIAYLSVACIALLLVTFFSIRSILPSSRDGIIKIYSENQYQFIDLPDGSDIILYPGSSVEFEKDFKGSERKITLNGTAYFNVQKNEKPFTAYFQNKKVMVLGTQFLIKTSLEKSEIDLFEGKLTAFIHGKKYDLRQDDNLELNENFIQPNILKKNLSERKDLSFTIHNTELKEVKQMLESIYDVEIEIENRLLSKKISGKVSYNNLPETLESICFLFGLTYEVKNNKKYTISY